MNTNDFKDLDQAWEDERARRLRHIRQAKTRLFVDTVLNALMALATLALIVLFCWHVSRRPVDERAAYLEGRFGIDHATAIAYAEEEVNSEKGTVNSYGTCLASSVSEAQDGQFRNCSLFTIHCSLPQEVR